MEKVKIKIITVQTIDEAGNEDVIELITEATLEKKEDHFIVNYDESNISEEEKNKTRLKIYNDKMLMTKVGDFSSRMEFMENFSYNDLYSTPYGTFDLFFYTNIYKYSLNEQGRGSLEIEYSIALGDASENYNKLKIEIY